MAKIKLTKNELRAQEYRLKQLNRYLPTLQLKKAMLQGEVFEARMEIESLSKRYQKTKGRVEEFSSLLSSPLPVDLFEGVKIETVQKRFENIAGVEVPYFESITFTPFEYDLFDSPVWIESAISTLEELATDKIRVEIAEEKKSALEEELRQVSIRVNLFEKILIPRALKNIKKIRVFLGDQELAAVGQVKVAKAKIEEKKNMAVQTV